MKKLVIYHGSEKIIQQPRLGLGRKNNDYGQGFYCTEDIELAKEWACKFGNNGFVNKYELDLTNLKILNIKDLNHNVLYWITILIKYREFNKTQMQKKIFSWLLNNYDIDLSKFDIVIGYRADDSYFSFAQDFLNNSLSLENLSLALKFGLLGEQIALISERAFAYLKYIESEPCAAKIYFDNFTQRDKYARTQYANLIDKSIITEGTFIMDIIRKGGM